MVFRFSKYVHLIYDWLDRIGEKDTQLPAVFPFLLYNGDEEWNAKIRYQDLIRKSIPIEFIPRFQYYLISIRKLDKSVLQRAENLVDAAFWMEKNKDIESLGHELNLLFNGLKRKEPLLWKELVVFVRGLFDQDALTDDQWKTIVQEEDFTMFDTTYKEFKEKLRNEGMEQGIEKGLEQGLEKGFKQGLLQGEQKLIHSAKNLLLMGLTVDQVSKATELPKEKVEELSRNLL